jgi:aspartate racemase
MRRIGLLGGTTWLSTLEYYRLLNEGVRDRLGGSHSADLVLRSVDFADVEALQETGDWAALGSAYAAEAGRLASAGAEVVGICANTMHLVYDDVAASGLETVHLVDAVARTCRGLGATKVGLLGTGYTMASPDLYPPRMAAHGVEVLVPPDDEAAAVHRIIYDELVLGQVRDESRDLLRAVVGQLVERGAQAIVLGCTELGMILSPPDSAVPLVDSLAAHVEALLGAALPALPVSEISMEEGAA